MHRGVSSPSRSLSPVSSGTVPRVQLFRLLRLFLRMTPIARERLLEAAEMFARKPAQDPRRLSLVSRENPASSPRRLRGLASRVLAIAL